MNLKVLRAILSYMEVNPKEMIDFLKELEALIFADENSIRYSTLGIKLPSGPNNFFFGKTKHDDFFTKYAEIVKHLNQFEAPITEAFTFHISEYVQFVQALYVECELQTKSTRGKEILDSFVALDVNEIEYKPDGLNVPIMLGHENIQISLCTNGWSTLINSKSKLVKFDGADYVLIEYINQKTDKVFKKAVITNIDFPLETLPTLVKQKH